MSEQILKTIRYSFYFLAGLLFLSANMDIYISGDYQILFTNLSAFVFIVLAGFMKYNNTDPILDRYNVIGA